MGVYTVNQTDGSLQRVAGGTLYADAPIGAIQSYGGVIAPAGWLICDGSAVSRTEYAELFAVIGIAFGVGDGETTFNLPDLREAVPKGAGLTGKTVGNHVKTNGLAVGEFLDDRIKAHSHKIMTYTGSQTAISNVYGNTGIASNIDAKDSLSYVTNVTRNGSKGPIIESTGSATTEVKSVGVNYIIKAKMVGVPADFMDALAKYNELSDFELMSASGTIQYDGFIYALTSTNKAAFRVELTRNEITLRLDGSYAGGGYGTSNCIPVKKGDIYISTDADIYGSFYKNR